MTREIAFSRLKRELFRKFIHMSIAIVPLLDAISSWMVLILLSSGIILYVFSESLRVEEGGPRKSLLIRIIQRFTLFVSRKNEPGDIMLAPISLAMGAILALLLFPPPFSYAGIYCLAFGDTAAILVGKTVGGPKLPLSGQKSWSGFLACWAVSAWFCWSLTGALVASIAAGAVAAFVEALQVQDADNIMIPLAAALVLEMGVTLF